MEGSAEMSWEDVVEALRAGARPEEVVSRARGLFSALPESPPPTSVPAAERPRGTAALYREFPGPGGHTVQFCYLRPPLPVLEAAEEDLESLNPLRFDTELCFDVLDLFEPRFMAPAPSVPLEELVKRPTRASQPAMLQTNIADIPRSEREWAAAYPALARATGASASDAAEKALRDAPECGLARLILRAVVPAIAPGQGANSTVAKITAQAAQTARLDELPVSKLCDIVAAVQLPAASCPAGNSAALAVLSAALSTPLT